MFLVINLFAPGSAFFSLYSIDNQKVAYGLKNGRASRRRKSSMLRFFSFLFLFKKLLPDVCISHRPPGPPRRTLALGHSRCRNSHESRFAKHCKKMRHSRPKIIPLIVRQFFDTFSLAKFPAFLSDIQRYPFYPSYPFFLPLSFPLITCRHNFFLHTILSHCAFPHDVGLTCNLKP